MQGYAQVTWKCYTILCKDQGHLRIDTLESIHRHGGTVVGASHLQTGRRYAWKDTSGAGLLFWKDPLCLSTQTLELQITLLPSRDIQVPDGHSLPGPSCMLGLWVMKQGWKSPKFPTICLGKGNASGSSSVPPTRLGSDLGHSMCVNWPKRTLQTQLASRRYFWGTFSECFF